MKKNILLFLFCFCFSFVFANDWHITQNIPPLATTYTSPGNIIIYPGVNYTIVSSGLLKMPAGKKITIMPGGQLTIDGGQVTSTGTNVMWDGIYVVSDNAIVGGISTIDVKNGAVIQNAKTAIRTWNGINRSTAGSIVKISDATFINNLMALQVVSDSYYLVSNSPYVRKSTFIINSNNYFSSNNLSFKAHAEIDSRSFTFQGCVFQNLTSASLSTTARGYGIIAYNSILNVKEYCDLYSTTCECGVGYVPSYFSGFNRAINYTHSGEGTRNNLNVSNTQFENNWYAIYTAGKNCDITKCSFTIPSGTSPMGIYLNNCSGYKIEENYFKGPLKVSVYTSNVGIRALNSGISGNQIYRNTFTYLTKAIDISGTNGVINGSGLQFQCNNFKSNSYDVFINDNATVASQQGLASKSAGNTFANSSVNIRGNNTMNIIYYFSGIYSTQNIYQPQYISGSVGTQSGALVNDCKPKNCKFYVIDTSISWPRDSFISAIEDIAIGKRNIVMDYDNLNNQYNSLVANFQEKGYDWILENFKANNKSDSEIDQEALTALEKLNEMAELSMVMAEVSDDYVRKLLNDKDADIFEFIEWYEKINTPEAKYSLADAYYETGDYEKAWQVINDIPDMFDFKQKEIIEHEDYVQYYKLRDIIRKSNRYWDKLTAQEISLLEKMAVNTIGPSSAKAQGILCFFYDNCIEVEQKMINISDMNETNKINVEIYPNPAKDIININFSEELSGDAQIEFYDIMGRKIYSHTVNSTTSQVNISELSNGVYTYRVIYNDSEMTHDKFIKQ